MSVGTPVNTGQHNFTVVSLSTRNNKFDVTQTDNKYSSATWARLVLSNVMSPGWANDVTLSVNVTQANELICGVGYLLTNRSDRVQVIQ